METIALKEAAVAGIVNWRQETIGHIIQLTEEKLYTNCVRNTCNISVVIRIILKEIL
jgi:hypothetical protein